MKKIVLVDDMDIFNFIMKKLITNIDPIYQVHDFTSGQKALDRLKELDPNVIFLDLHMPEIDGWKFLDYLQAHNLPYKVYILSSSTSELDRQRSTHYQNVITFLSKPVAADQLAQILQTV